jgi:hypothetical protein
MITPSSKTIDETNGWIGTLDESPETTYYMFGDGTQNPIYDRHPGIRWRNIDVAGFHEGDWFKIGCQAGGIATQEDECYFYVKFLDSTGDIIEPDNVQDIDYSSRVIYYNGIEYEIDSMIDGQLTDTQEFGGFVKGSDPSVSANNNSKLTNWWSYTCPVINRVQRGDETKVMWTALISQIPPGAVTAHIGVNFVRVNHADSDGWLGNPFFKISATKPDLGIELL